MWKRAHLRLPIMSHQAAWINAKHVRLEVSPVDTPRPGERELLVKIKAIACNPLDSKLQRFEGRPLTYPMILGQSFAGIVEDTGRAVSNFSIGDRVAVIRPPSKLSDHRFGGFQQYALASAATTSKLHPETPFNCGASTILNLAAVASAPSLYIGLDRPTLTGDFQPKGRKVLIYGGSSSSGGLAIDYARGAGYDVVTTSSPKNYDLVSSHGSSVIVIDHTQPAEKVVQDIHSNGPYLAIFDTIGLPPVTKILTTYLSGLGGGSYNTLTALSPNEDPIPSNVQRKYEAYARVFSEGGGEEHDWFYNELVPQGLASGKITATAAQLLAGGLEEAQHALDLLAQGQVSGSKLVIDPWAAPS